MQAPVAHGFEESGLGIPLWGLESHVETSTRRSRRLLQLDKVRQGKGRARHQDAGGIMFALALHKDNHAQPRSIDGRERPARWKRPEKRLVRASRSRYRSQKPLGTDAVWRRITGNGGSAADNASNVNARRTLSARMQFSQWRQHCHHRCIL